MYDIIFRVSNIKSLIFHLFVGTVTFAMYVFLHMMHLLQSMVLLSLSLRQSLCNVDDLWSCRLG